jgi:hypothetical protein
MSAYTFRRLKEEAKKQEAAPKPKKKAKKAKK